MQLYDQVGVMLYGMVVLMWRELVMFSAAVVVYVLFQGAFQVPTEADKDDDEETRAARLPSAPVRGPM